VFSARQGGQPFHLPNVYYKAEQAALAGGWGTSQQADFPGFRAGK